MRLLLDTHVWIWYLTASPDLGSAIRALIESDRNELFLSPISVWEVLILAERGRLDLRPDPQSWTREALNAFPIIEAAFNTEIAIQSRSIDLPHDDPADRFLAATARVYKAVLVTRDRRLLQSNAVETFQA